MDNLFEKPVHNAVWHFSCLLTNTTMFLWHFLFLFFQPHNLLNKIKTSTSEKEQEQLMKISQEDSLYATLLPIKTVGVQVSLGVLRV